MINSPIQVVIADDNRFFCDALKDSLQQHKEITVTNTFTTLNELISFTNNSFLNILILDINFNGLSSLDYIKQIKPKEAFFKIIALTTLNNNYIKEKALENGVDLFVGKDSNLSAFKNKILDCFHNDNQQDNNSSSKIHLNNFIFTKRKLEILQVLYKHSDKTEKEISTILCISESALKSHKRELFEITNTKNTLELIKFGIQNGLIIA